MTQPVRFNFVCSRRFLDLPGTDLRIRHCGDCDLDVHNFDVIPEWQRSVMMKDAAASHQRLCISITQRSSDLEPCPRPALSDDLGLEAFDGFATAGEPELPTEDDELCPPVAGNLMLGNEDDDEGDFLKLDAKPRQSPGPAMSDDALQEEILNAIQSSDERRG